MDNTRRKYLILSLKLLYMLPLVVTAIVLYMYVRLLSEGHSYKIIRAQLFLLVLLIFGFIVYLSSFLNKTTEKQTRLWLSGIINGLGWLFVCLFSILKTFSFGIAFTDLIWYLIIVYMGLITFLNYLLYRYDTSASVNRTE
jgi:hypothetical protein